MKKIISVLLVLAMLTAVLVSCGNDDDKQSTTPENTTAATTAAPVTTASDAAETTAATEETSDATTESEPPVETTIPETSATTATEETTATSEDNGLPEWAQNLTFENGILKTYVGAFHTTTFDKNPENVYEINANIVMEYDATIFLLFTSTCTPCKNMAKNVLQPYYEKNKSKGVMVIGLLEAGRNSSAEATIAEWKQANGITFPTISVGTSVEETTSMGFIVGSPFGGSGLGSLGTGVPQTYILDRTGALGNSIYGYDGSTGAARLDGMITKIRVGYKK